MARKTSLASSKRQYVEGHNTAALRLARSFPQAKQAIFPGFIPPSLATLAQRPPRGKTWVHEIKYDGYRFQCHVQQRVRFYTRRGNDWSERLAHLALALQPLTDRAMIRAGPRNGEKPKMAWRQTETSYVGPFAEFDRVWPAAGLTLALIAIVSSIGLLGYVAIKLL